MKHWHAAPEAVQTVPDQHTVVHIVEDVLQIKKGKRTKANRHICEPHGVQKSKIEL